MLRHPLTTTGEFTLDLFDPQGDPLPDSLLQEGGTLPCPVILVRNNETALSRGWARFETTATWNGELQQWLPDVFIQV
ncbi:MAG: hypothetical protein ACE5JX_17370 [Acidobacteriota bacterium]